MTEVPASPWIHIGECPVCVNGLCRVRTCEDQQGQQHFYAMCDECEATWLSPSTDTPRSFPDPDNPLCPVCDRVLYNEQAHWSLAEELSGSPWAKEAVFDVPSSGVSTNTDEDRLTPGERGRDASDASVQRGPGRSAASSGDPDGGDVP